MSDEGGLVVRVRVLFVGLGDAAVSGSRLDELISHGAADDTSYKCHISITPIYALCIMRELRPGVPTYS